MSRSTGALTPCRTLAFPLRGADQLGRDAARDEGPHGRDYLRRSLYGGRRTPTDPELVRDEP